MTDTNATGTEPTAGRRGQAAVVGIVLLVGIVAIGSIGILLIGANANEESQERAQDERVKRAFVELGGDVDSVARSDADNRRVNLDLPDDADVAIRRETAGQIVINRTNLTTTKTVVVKKIGAIVYRSQGSQYAYQAGAVWSGEANETRLVSAPPIEYDFESGGESPTLTLPITDMEGPDRLNSGEVQVRKIETISPLNDVATVDNQVVTVKITSDYYVGWAQYFRDRYDNAAVSINHSNETTTIELGKREIGGDYDEAVDASSYGSGAGGGGVNGPMTVAASSMSGTSESCSDPDNTCGVTSTLTPLDAVISGQISRAKGTGDDWTNIDAEVRAASGPPLEGGKYYTEGFELDGETLEVDLSDGNVSVVVDGPIAIDSGGTIEVTNADQNDTCCYARFYVGGGPNGRSGDVAIANGGESTRVFDTSGTQTNNATRVQIYGTSEMQFDQGQGSFYGAVYAPRNAPPTGPNQARNSAGPYPGIDTPPSGGAVCNSNPGVPDGDVCIGTGSNGFTGALIGFDQVVTTASGQVTYDPDLQNVEPTLAYSGVIPPPITFLHVSVNRVCVTGEDTTGGCPAAGNSPPTVSWSGVPSTVTEGSSTSLTVSASDPDGSVSSYTYSATDGSISGSGSSVTYDAPSVSSDETVDLSVTVTDNDGGSTTKTVSLTVEDTGGNAAPTPSFTSSSPGGTTVDFDASASGDSDGSIATYEWDFDDDGTYETTTTSPTTSHTYPTPGSYDVTLRVEDDDGATNAVTDTVTVSLAGSPPSIDAFEFEDQSSTPPAPETKYQVDWSVSDPDGDLSSVTVYVNTSGSNEKTFTGFSGSGTYQKNGNPSGTYTVRIVAEDSTGHTRCWVFTDTADGVGEGEKSDGDGSTC